MVRPFHHYALRTSHYALKDENFKIDNPDFLCYRIGRFIFDTIPVTGWGEKGCLFLL